ncbi:MAG: SLC13 family permease [Planctomycetota bacterium]
MSSAALLGQAAHAAHEVPAATTWLFTGLLVALVVCLALEEKLHAKKSLIVACFAILALLLGTALHLLPFGPYRIGGHDVDLPVYVPAIDWGVITIILGSSLFIDVTSRSGLFTWIAVRLTKASGGDPRRLLWCYGLMTVLFSAVLNNVTAMILVGSLTGVSLDRLGRKDHLLGFLLVEGLLTNVGGLLTLISSVPNIIVGTAAGISFLDFFVKAAPFVVAATWGTILVGARTFDVRPLAGDAERQEALAMVAAFDETDGIESPGFFRLSTALLAAFILVIATTSVLPWVSDLGMGFVAMLFGTVALLRFKHEVDRFYQGVDWDLLAFFAGLFAFIHVLEQARVLAMIGHGIEAVIGLGETAGGAALLLSSAGFSSVTDNIPLSAMLARILAGIPAAGGGVRGPDDPMWWSVVFGANLGGNLTPIGSASTLVAVTLIHRYRIPLGFGAFIRKALPFAGFQLALAVVYVLLFL